MLGVECGWENQICPTARVWRTMRAWIAETDMGPAGLERLAVKLGRPVRSLAAFGRLTPQELAALDQAIDEACRREREALRTGSPRSLPSLLRRVALWLLGWREP